MPTMHANTQRKYQQQLGVSHNIAQFTRIALIDQACS
jgi:hypothetical protein